MEVTGIYTDTSQGFLSTIKHKKLVECNKAAFNTPLLNTTEYAESQTAILRRNFTSTYLWKSIQTDMNTSKKNIVLYKDLFFPRKKEEEGKSIFKQIILFPKPET